MLALVARVAPSRATVLLLGESGTGKELVARAVHEASDRAQRPLVAVDCSSLPETLFESALFGHERGAFTGATSTQPGLVEAANGGTLFIDEVGDIALTMQVKLLRLLESGTYRRVGSTELRHADIRVVSATHRDLEQMVSDGRFREDLYYRLSTFPIHLPALRERREDIPLLAMAMLQRVAPQRPLALSPEALALLQAQDYPGNVHGPGPAVRPTSNRTRSRALRERCAGQHQHRHGRGAESCSTIVPPSPGATGAASGRGEPHWQPGRVGHPPGDQSALAVPKNQSAR